MALKNADGQWMIAWILIGVVYAISWLWLPQGVFWSPDEGGKYLIAEAIEWQNGLRYALPYPGAALDPAYRFFPGAFPGIDYYPRPQEDGSLEFAWPVGFSFLARGVEQAFGRPAVFGLPLCFGWLCAGITGLLARRIRTVSAPSAILLAGLATPLWFYSLTFWEHTLVTLLALAGLLALLPTQGRPRYQWLFGGLLLAATIYLRSEMIAFAAAASFAWLWFVLAEKPALRKWGALAFGGLILAGVSLIFWLPELPWLAPRHQRELNALLETTGAAPLDTALGYARNLPYWLVNFPAGEGPRLPEFWGWVGVGGLLACLAAEILHHSRAQAALLLAGLGALITPSVLALTDSSPFRAMHGLALLAPFLGLTLFGLPLAWRGQNRSLSFLAKTLGGYLILGIGLLLFARGNPARGIQVGLEWGMRYLLPVYPLGVVLALAAFEEIQTDINHKGHEGTRRKYKEPLCSFVSFVVKISSKTLSKALIWITVFAWLIGVQWQIRGVMMLNDTRQTLATWQNALPTSKNNAVLTDIVWFPASFAAYAVSHPVYTLQAPSDAGDWATQAARAGVTEAVFVSWQPAQPEWFSNTTAKVTLRPATNTRGLYLTPFQITTLHP